MVNYQEIYDQNKQKYNDLCVNQLGGMSDTAAAVYVLAFAIFVLVIVLISIRGELYETISQYTDARKLFNKIIFPNEAQ